MVIEQAKTELEILESQYPNSFQSLKLDLKTFISQLEEEEKLSSQQYSIPTTTASTHVSSTKRKKRKKGSTDVKEMRDDEAQSKLEVPASRMLYFKRSYFCDDSYVKRRDMSTDAAIERARVCLQKVQQFKTTFL